MTWNILGMKHIGIVLLLSMWTAQLQSQHQEPMGGLYPNTLTIFGDEVANGISAGSFGAKLSVDTGTSCGIGVRIAGTLLGTSLRHNLNGTDLLPLLCCAANEANIPLVLIGGKAGVAQECAARLRRDTPGLRIRLVSRGFLTKAEAEDLSKRIRDIGRCIVLVGMGSPLQEAWSWRYLPGLRNVTVVTVGGLFDFFSDRIPRAPLAWRELGLEWLWRLRMEPRRLAKRYLLGNPLFLMLTILQRLRQTFHREQVLETAAPNMLRQ